MYYKESTVQAILYTILLIVPSFSMTIKHLKGFLLEDRSSCLDYINISESVFFFFPKILRKEKKKKKYAKKKSKINIK